MANQRFKPVQFVRQEDFDALTKEVSEVLSSLNDGLNALDTHLSVLQLAVIQVASDNEAISDVLVSAGLLEADIEEPEGEIEEPEGEIEEPEGEIEDEVQVEEFDEADLTDDLDLGHGPVDEPSHEELLATHEGMPEPRDETPAEKATRLEAVRARREARVREQGIKDFEGGNEDPLAAAAVGLEPEEIGNMVTDVPDEGIVIRSSTADQEAQRGV
jgi:hypothetical protein